jgi:hypothetical protein
MDSATLKILSDIENTQKRTASPSEDMDEDEYEPTLEDEVIDLRSEVDSLKKLIFIFINKYNTHIHRPDNKVLSNSLINTKEQLKAL